MIFLIEMGNLGRRGGAAEDNAIVVDSGGERKVGIGCLFSNILYMNLN